MQGLGSENFGRGRKREELKLCPKFVTRGSRDHRANNGIIGPYASYVSTGRQLKPVMFKYEKG